MTSSSRRVILSVSIASLLTVARVQAQVIVRGTNLVELRAADATAGTASWTNTGSLGGSFTEVGDASVSTINAGAFGTVPIVNFDPNEAYRGMMALAAITGSGTRSIEVWMLNPTLSGEDTMVAW